MSQPLPTTMRRSVHELHDEALPFARQPEQRLAIKWQAAAIEAQRAAEPTTPPASKYQVWKFRQDRATGLIRLYVTAVRFKTATVQPCKVTRFARLGGSIEEAGPLLDKWFSGEQVELREADAAELLSAYMAAGPPTARKWGSEQLRLISSAFTSAAALRSGIVLDRGGETD